MSPPERRPPHQIIEVRLPDAADEAVVLELEIRRELTHCRASTVILDLQGSSLPRSFLSLLTRVRQYADQQGIFCCLRVRDHHTAEMLQQAGLEHILRVTRTFAQARAWSDVCCPPSRSRPRSRRRMSTRLKAHLYQLICPDADAMRT
ncbi:hypothetical protein [Streptomyces sp. NPDC095817]|uniref:hypothetical protein n=1 Tax=Streptomyces sp. NPDC095817 TaxID=3155082 RepID=UPI00331D836A